MPVAVVDEDRSCTSKECIKQLIEFYATLYGVKQDIALGIARCESEFRYDVKGDGGKAYGVYQFHKPTFEEFKVAFGDTSLDYKNPKDAIQLAMWAISQGKQNHWTCYEKVKSKKFIKS